MIRAITFGLYGTLLDWLPLWIEASEQIVNRNVIELSAQEFALKWREKHDEVLSAQEFTPYFESITKALELMLAEFDVSNEFYETLFKLRWKNIEPFDEAIEVLTKLKEKYPLAVCENSSREFFDICAAKLPAFDHVLISDETKVNKPHKKMYTLVQEALSVEPSEILHLTSSQVDVKGAKESGFNVCWLNRLSKQSTGNADYEIKDLRELPSILENS